MATKKGSCVVILEIDPQGATGVFNSEAMRKTLEAKAAELVEKKTQLAEPHLHGPMPRNGLYGFKIKNGKKTQYAVIHPMNQAGYNIARKHGTY